MKEKFKNWSKFDFAWLLIANLTILGLSLYWGDKPIAIISAMTGITCTIFVSKQMVANYLFGVINVCLYAYLSFQSKLYGDFMLNAFYYLPMQFIGAYMWIKSSKEDDSGEVVSKRMSKKDMITTALGCILGIVIYSLVLNALGGNIPVIDATSTVLSVVAMILMVRQYLEQWYLWVIVNSVSIIMWAVSLSQGSGDMATLIMWTLYLLNSLYGLYSWIKANKATSIVNN